MAEAAIKSLADGQLAATKTEIYPSPTSTQTIVQSITLVNDHSSALVVNIYFKASGGTSRRISIKNYSLAAGAMMEVLEKPKTLEAADILEGSGGTAAKVDFTISGIQNS